MIKTFSLSVLIIVITILFSKTNIYSVEPEEFLQNPKQELKARNISKNVRC
jgi:cytochrome c-type biogenesis protein CcmH/NrfF